MSHTTSDIQAAAGSTPGSAIALMLVALTIMIIACPFAQAQDEKAPVVDPALETGESGFPGPDEFVAADSQPKMTHYETPDYPTIAQRAGLWGTVWVKALVDTEGKARDAVIAKTSGERLLDQAALDAAIKNKFEPAVFRGEAVAYWVTYKVEFDLGR